MRDSCDAVEADDPVARPGPDVIAGAPDRVCRVLEAVQAIDDSKAVSALGESPTP